MNIHPTAPVGHLLMAQLSVALQLGKRGAYMQVALTTLRAALSDKLGCVLTPELVAEIVFRTAKEALDHHAPPVLPEPLEAR